MTSSEKPEAVVNLIDTNVNAAKPNKWNEQPHIGKYKLIKTIGKGNFAKVKLAQHVTTGKKVAVKVIDKTALNNSSLQKLFREVKIMKTIEHPNIVKLFEVIESERHVYLVMEYASKGEVFDFLVQNGRMKETEARQRFREIVSAIQYCHQNNIVHRDLKAENLLLSCDFEIKIADFGFANYFDCKKQLDTFCGSPPYAAPELFQGRKYEGPEVDVWSLGVILYTLVSGSLPFDGHNMRDLRERVLKGKYRIPFYMSTDCELLLKKMLIVNPQKRYTLLEVMKDKWINMGYEDFLLQPYKEPLKNYNDPVRLAIMENLGFSKDEILDSLYNAKFNNITATYLLLDDDGNVALENSSTSASINSLKNISTYLAAKGIEKSGKTVTRSGSASEGRASIKIDTNDGNKDSYKAVKNNLLHINDVLLNETENTLKVKSNKVSNMKQSPSMGATHIYSQDEVPTLTHTLVKSHANPIRIPGIQPKINSIAPKLNKDKLELHNDDKLLMPLKTNTCVKRNNTFTYADKNTTSEIESKPVTRTKHVMNMNSHVTPTIPLSFDNPVTISSDIHGSNEIIIKLNKTRNDMQDMVTQGVVNIPKYETLKNNIKINLNGPSTTNEDQLHLETCLSENNPPVIISLKEGTIQHKFGNTSDTMSSVNNSASGSKELNDAHPQQSNAKQVNSGKLFRSFTNKISSKPQPIQEPHVTDTSPPCEHTETSLHVRRHSTGDKLIRRLISQNPTNHKNKRTSEYDASNNADPWTLMETTTESNEKWKVSASSDFTDEKNLTLDKVHQRYTIKTSQSKPRLMHLVFRKNLTSKLRPDAIISEMLRSIGLAEEIEFEKVEQIDTFVIECQGRLRADNEVIHWEIEVFRLPRSSSCGVRIKKASGSSSRFKAIQKILVNRLSPVLCTNG